MLVRIEVTNAATDWHQMEVPTLSVAKLVAQAYGFNNVDIEPMEPGRVFVSASSDSGPRLVFSGTTIHDAAHKLIEALVGK